MKVLKFGGTSVGSIESLKNVKKIVESIEGEAVVVVSALGGITDKLITTAEKAASGNADWAKEMRAIRERHHDIIKGFFSGEERERVEKKVETLLNSLEKKYEGLSLLNALPEKTLDLIVSYGEAMSSEIVAALIKNGKRYYSPEFIKTERWYGKNIANRKLTDQLIKEAFSSIQPGEKAIVPGFISMDGATNEITNLGRGGSDFTGALIAAALNAEVLEIWTDVDGFMTADPRVVKDALIISHLSFTESMELCTFGAKVIYPPTIYPVFHNNISIKILNTFNPEAPGTLITDQSLPEDLEIKGVTALKGVSLISLDIKTQTDMPVLPRALNILSKQGVRLIPVANPEPDFEINIAVLSNEAEKSIEILEKEFAPEIAKNTIGKPQLKNGLAAVALVGKEMKSRGRFAARIGHSLRRTGINVEAYSPGNSDTTLIYIIDEGKSSEALPIIHSLIYS